MYEWKWNVEVKPDYQYSTNIQLSNNGDDVALIKKTAIKSFLYTL